MCNLKLYFASTADIVTEISIVIPENISFKWPSEEFVDKILEHCLWKCLFQKLSSSGVQKHW